MAVGDATRRGTLYAILAESSRQAGLNVEAIAAAGRGLEAASESAPADLKLRLGIVQALGWHADHQSARGLERLDALLAGQAARLARRRLHPQGPRLAALQRGRHRGRAARPDSRL
jgi:hypothetical protein